MSEPEVNIKVLAKGNDVIGANNNKLIIKDSSGLEFLPRKYLQFSDFFTLTDNGTDTISVSIGTIPINPPSTTGLNAYILDDDIQGFGGMVNFSN